MLSQAATRFETREATEEDLPFVYATWLRGLRYGNEAFGLIEQSVYYKYYHQYIGILLKHPDTRVLVACLPDDEDVILGYSVLGKEGTVHYVHVKDAFRKFGIARGLVPKNIKIYTHFTKVGLAILKSKFPNAEYNPFL